ncbi:MAG: hypothetical protein ABGY72_00525 [bacterium]
MLSVLTGGALWRFPGGERAACIAAVVGLHINPERLGAAILCWF